MDTPKDAYEEAIEKIYQVVDGYVNDRCDDDDVRHVARRVAEAIGLREMMERLAVLEAAREDALDHGVSTHG